MINFHELEVITKKIKNNSAHSYILIEVSGTNLKNRKYNEAIQNYTSAKADINRGIAYDNIQIYDEAIQDYTRAIQINPEYANAYNNRGEQLNHIISKCLSQNQKYDEAIQDHTKKIQIHPEFAKAYSNRGNVYYDIQKYDQAIQDYTRAIQIDPKDTTAFRNRGNVNSNIKNYDHAINDFTNAIQINPEDASSFLKRGNFIDFIIYAYTYIKLGLAYLDFNNRN